MSSELIKEATVLAVRDDYLMSIRMGWHKPSYQSWPGMQLPLLC